MISIFGDKKIILTIFIMILIIIASTIFIIKPIAKKSIDVYQNQKVQQKELEILKSNLANLQQMDKDLASVAELDKKIEFYLPGDEGIADLWNQFHALGSITGNEILNINPTSLQGKGKKADSKTTTTTESPKNDGSKLIGSTGTEDFITAIHLQGNYEQLYAYLAGLENMSRANVIYNIDISQAAGTLSTKLGIISFYKAKR